MKKKVLLPILAMILAAAVLVFANKTETAKTRKSVAQTIKQIPPDREKSLQAFGTILTVLKSPRCINCHPSGDVPHQGEMQRLHPFGVIRGVANHGGLVQKCGTCHHTENNNFANVPGAPHWGLAPKTMGWFGLSDSEIAKRLLDKKQNEGRSPQDLVKHMSSDSLVLWAWNPGAGRSKPPVDSEFWRKVLQT